MKLLEGKTAVVTGGTRGIGYAIVSAFLNEGAKVALLGSRKETAEKAVANVLAENPGAPVMGLWPSLTSPQEMAEAMQAVKARFGSVDILINNAGISQSTPLADYTEKDMDAILNLNIKAVVVGSQAAVKVMREQGRGGVIINTSSMVSLSGQPAGCLYPASKFAVNGLTISLARELAKDGIRVNAVAPGVTKTDMMANLPEQMIAPIAARIPLGRIGESEDMANAFVFLCSDRASYITGALLSVDGGMRV